MSEIRELHAINLHCRKLPRGRILKIYTRELGLLTVSAERLAGRSEPFVHNKYEVILKNNSDIQNIRSSEFINYYSHIGENLQALYYAWFFVELLEIFSHTHDPHSFEIFDLFLHTLVQLDQPLAERDIEKIALIFVFDFIQLSGFRPDLSLLDISDHCYFDLADGKLISITEYNHLREYSPQYYALEILPGIAESLRLLLTGKYDELSAPKISFLNRIWWSYIVAHSNRSLKTIQFLDL